MTPASGLSMPDDAKRVAIVGGGFAGVDTARTLRRRLPPGWEVVIYSEENPERFAPPTDDQLKVAEAEARTHVHST